MSDIVAGDKVTWAGLTWEVDRTVGPSRLWLSLFHRTQRNQEVCMELATVLTERVVKIEPKYRIEEGHGGGVDIMYGKELVFARFYYPDDKENASRVLKLLLDAEGRCS